ncbi:hypothetical protein MMC2321_00709 [Chitinophaga sp. MM2321]
MGVDFLYYISTYTIFEKGTRIQLILKDKPDEYK